MQMANLEPQTFRWETHGSVARIRLDRPERKNPLTFESYAELRDTFRDLVYATDIDVVVLASNGGNFPDSVLAGAASDSPTGWPRIPAMAAVRRRYLQR